MATFQSKPYRSKSYQNTIAAKYRYQMNKHPFALFGLPFILTILAGSFFLTPAQALRYEKHDLKVKKMTQKEKMGLDRTARKVDMNEEYYRLAAKDIGDWENKRVDRLPGESENLWGKGGK